MAKDETVLKTIGRIADVDAARWDALANPELATFNPFVQHAFLKALEDAGTTGGRSGWQPCHVVLEHAGEVVGVMPTYGKSHSQGEYIFDHGWADAWERILALPLARIRREISADTVRARELRQSSPFTGVLNEQERRLLREAVEARTQG